MNLSKWQKELFNAVEAGKIFIYSTGRTRSKARFWRKWLEATHKPELKKPKINLITFDEYAEIAPKNWKKIEQLTNQDKE